MAYLDRYKERRIQLADGRSITGRAPGLSGVSQLEHLLRDELARRLGGVTEARLPYGRADVLTATAVYEVESLGGWRTGVRQVLAYSAQSALPPVLALFGQAHHSEVLKMYLKLRDGRPPIGLYWHNGYGWQDVSSRAACRNMGATDTGILDALAQRLRNNASVDDITATEELRP